MRRESSEVALWACNWPGGPSTASNAEPKPVNKPTLGSAGTRSGTQLLSREEGTQMPFLCVCDKHSVFSCLAHPGTQSCSTALADKVTLVHRVSWDWR